VLAVLTAVLVVLTGYYAWQTRAMVTEMRNARQLSLRPKIVLDVELLGPTFGVIVLANVGAGAALNADLTLRFHRPDGEVGDERRWLEHVIAPGERHQFLPPEGVDYMDGFAEIYPRVAVEGAITDVFDERIAVTGEVFIAKAWDHLKKANRRFDRPALERLVREAEEIRKAFEKAVAELRRLAEAANRPQPDEEMS
jgi:hypothetical protein